METAIRLVNLTSEVNNNARKVRVNRQDKRNVPRDESRRGTGKPQGVPMWEAVALQPPPPCDHPDLGPCPFLAQCTNTGSICPAFTKYVGLKPYLGGNGRVPNRHYDDLALVQKRREPVVNGSIDPGIDAEYNTDQREVVHTGEAWG